MTPHIRQLQSAELHILREIDRICKLRNIEYFLAGGTALGAVRHGGFIPWDDDLDIVMERENYEAFIDACETELGDGFFMQNASTDPSFNLYLTKIRLDGTKAIDKRTASLPIHSGIYVDIFPLDHARAERSLILTFRYVTFRACASLRSLRLGVSQPTTLFKRFAAGPLRTFSRLVPVPLVDRIAYSSMKGATGTRRAKYLVNFPSQYGLSRQTIPISFYRPARLIKFEGFCFPAPREVEKYLTRIYGDYMSIPSVENRKTIHEFIEIDLGPYDQCDFPMGDEPGTCGE